MIAPRRGECWRLVIRPLPGFKAAPIDRLRRLLKVLGRFYGFAVVELFPAVPDEPSRPATRDEIEEWLTR